MKNLQLTEKLVSYIVNNDLKSFNIIWSKRSTQNAVDLDALFSAAIEAKDVWFARNFFNSMKDHLHKIKKPTVLKILEYGREDLLHCLQESRANGLFSCQVVTSDEILNAALHTNNPQLFYNYSNKTFSSTAVHSRSKIPLLFDVKHNELYKRLIDQKDLRSYVQHFVSTKNHSFLMTIAVLIAEQNDLEKMQKFVEWGGLVKGPVCTFSHIYHHAFSDATFYIENNNNRKDLLTNILPLMTWLANLSQENLLWEKVMREHINKNFYLYCIKATGHSEHIQNVLPTIRTKHAGKHADLAAEMSQYLLTQSIEQHLTMATETRKRRM